MFFRRSVYLSVAILGLAGLFVIGCQPHSDLDYAERLEPTEVVLATNPLTATPSSIPPIKTDTDPPAFYFGVDLSYVNEMDDCGAIFRENGESKDAFELFRSQGTNLVRARLWHNPDWTDYSTLEDVTRTFYRAQTAGMDTLLSIHYSDNWADPGKQAIPAAWEAYSEEELPEVLYQYTYDVLFHLYQNGLLPDFVQVGNEINSGLVKRVGGLDWPRDVKLINAGIRAIRDIQNDTGFKVQAVLHVAQPENTGWWFREAIEADVDDFDVIGISYYPQWSSFSIGDVGAHAAYLREQFNKDVLIVETAYPWTLEKVEESADNILYQGVRGYPISIEGQRQFMIDLSQSLISNGGLGVVYWEPAWVSTKCTTRWGQGSHWENAVFFDFNNENELHAGIEFLSFPYQFPEVVYGIIEDLYGNPILQDEQGDNLEKVAHLDLRDLYVRDDQESLYLAITIEGDIYANPWGSFLVYIDTTHDEHGAKADVDKRPIQVVEPYLPEYRLDISAVERNGTVSASTVFYHWDGVDWTTLTMIGGVGVRAGTPSTIEIQLPKSTIGHPNFVNLAVVSVGRGRVHSAGDVLGAPLSISDWNEPVLLDVFATFMMTE